MKTGKYLHNLYMYKKTRSLSRLVEGVILLFLIKLQTVQTKVISKLNSHRKSWLEFCFQVHKLFDVQRPLTMKECPFCDHLVH